MAKDLKELREEYRIYADAPLNPRDNSGWPKKYSAVFRHIRQLGKADLQRYQEGFSADLLYKPWKEQTPHRVKRIAKLAKRRTLRQEDGNEGWDELERVVLGRFSVEVACRKCRARLWRSEVETQTPSSEVENRQSCPSELLGSDENSREFCTRSLFDDRGEDTIVSLDAKQPEGQRHESQQNPYRIYGLRKTQELRRLNVWVPDGSHSNAAESAGDTVNRHASVADAGSVLFPFLVVEDASETRLDGATNVGMQTNFAIRRLLGLQYELQGAVKNGADWDVPPLVWLISRRAEQWGLHAAYIEKKRNTINYRMFRVWKGGLDSAEDAFQLLLYIDYIIDWARDIYREDVIRTLKLLDVSTRTVQASSVNDSATAADDSEPSFVLSPVSDDETAGTITPGTEVRSREADLPITKGNTRCRPEGQKGGVEDALRAFDSPHGVIRDARYIRSRFIGLYVTEDNFGILMHSAASPDGSKKLATNILNCLKEAWRVRRDALDTIEAIWTDTDRLGGDAYPADKAFLVVFTAVAYLTPDWEQTREMGYLAVAEILLESLLEVAGQHRFPREAALGAPFMRTGKLAELFTGLLRSTAEQNLTACSARACWETGICPRAGGRGSNRDQEEQLMWRLVCVEERKDEVVHRLDVVMKPSRTPKARSLVFDLYRRHRVGRNEPSSSLFRISDYLDILGSPEQLGKLRGVVTPITMWPGKAEFPGDGEQAFALVMPTDSTKSPGQADFCIFVMNPAAVQAGVEPDTLQQSTADWHFQAKRFDRASARGGRVWNSADVVSNDQEAVAPKLAAYIQHLRAAEGQGGAKPFDGAPEPLRFWRPAKPGKEAYVMTCDGNAPHALDAHMLANNLPHHVRLTSVSWKKPASRFLFIHEDGVRRLKGGGYALSNPKAPMEPDEENSAFSGTGRSKLPVGGQAAPVNLTAEAEDSASERLMTNIAMNHADDAGAEPSSRSRGKRRAGFGEPESEAGPSSPKRSRLSAAENSHRGEGSSSSTLRSSQSLGFKPKDWVTDEDFEMLLQKGIFA